MSIFKTILNSISAPITAIGDVIDKTSTSDEEKLKLKNEASTILNNFSTNLLNQLLILENELTARQKNDMQSDSWLSKNIRPLVLAFLTVTTVILAYASIFVITDVTRLTLLQPWIEMIKVLNMTVFTFYFGSRGIEKGIKMISETIKNKQ